MTAPDELWRPSWVVLGAGRAQDPEWMRSLAEEWVARPVDVDRDEREAS